MCFHRKEHFKISAGVAEMTASPVAAEAGPLLHDAGFLGPAVWGMGSTVTTWRQELRGNGPQQAVLQPGKPAPPTVESQDPPQAYCLSFPFPLLLPLPSDCGIEHSFTFPP